MAIGAGDLKGVSIVVIGAGAVGSVVGYRLAQAGAFITVVDSQPPGTGTTGNTFAWLNSFNKSPKNYNDLNRKSIVDHQSLQDELGGNWVHLSGLLQWANSGDNDSAQQLAEKVNNLRNWGLHVDEIEPHTVMNELEPKLKIDEDRVQTVYRVDSEGWLDGAEMARSLVHATTDHFGGKYETANVTGIAVDNNRVASVVLDNGRQLDTELIINAAGPDAGMVASLAGASLPVDRVVGMIVQTEQSPVSITHVVRCPETNMRPDGVDSGKFLLHPPYLDNYVSENEPTSLTHPVVDQAMDGLRSIAPDLRNTSAERLIVGVRPIPRDGFPIVGFDNSVGGFYSVVTHSGITLSARLGRLVADDLVLGGVSELDDYRPSRFAL